MRDGEMQRRWIDERDREMRGRERRDEILASIPQVLLATVEVATFCEVLTPAAPAAPAALQIKN